VTKYQGDLGTTSSTPTQMVLKVSCQTLAICIFPERSLKFSLQCHSSHGILCSYSPVPGNVPVNWAWAVTIEVISWGQMSTLSWAGEDGEAEAPAEGQNFGNSLRLEMLPTANRHLEFNSLVQNEIQKYVRRIICCDHRIEGWLNVKNIYLIHHLYITS
jgi:hypothetical protein